MERKRSKVVKKCVVKKDTSLIKELDQITLIMSRISTIIQRTKKLLNNGRKQDDVS